MDPDCEISIDFRPESTVNEWGRRADAAWTVREFSKLRNAAGFSFPEKITGSMISTWFSRSIKGRAICGFDAPGFSPVPARVYGTRCEGEKKHDKQGYVLFHALEGITFKLFFLFYATDVLRIGLK
jgi:hypothetical protein